MQIIIDAHVHIYDCFDLSDLPERSALLLTERPSENFFEKSRTDPNFAQRDETCLTRSSMYLFAGSQLITREGLEVHALLCAKKFEERKPIRDLICKIQDSGALACLPFSPGKWLGPRGKIVEDLLEQSKPGELFFSDSRLRPALWRSSHLKRAHERGFAILRGSDPLPYRGEERAIGSYGTVLNLDLQGSSPTEALKSALSSSTASSHGRNPIVAANWLRALLRM